MSVMLQNVGLPLFVTFCEGGLQHLPSVLADHHLTFRRVLVLTGCGPTQRFGQQIGDVLKAQGMIVDQQQVQAATFTEVDRIKQQHIERFFPDVLLAIGGGSVIDPVKLAASERRLPWISIPSAASNDGFCSPVAVLSTESGQRRSVGATMPMGAIIDLPILMQAPQRLQLAGVGDLLSNVSAVMDWTLATGQGKASLNGVVQMLALAGPRQLGICRNVSLSNPDFVRLLVEGLVLSGVAMEISGSTRPCSGSEHLISHAIDALGQHASLHGEQVGVAMLFCAALQEIDLTPFTELARKLGMPMTPQDIGLSRDTFLEAVRRAPNMRPGRWTILSSDFCSDYLFEETYDQCYGRSTDG